MSLNIHKRPRRATKFPSDVWTLHTYCMVCTVFSAASSRSNNSTLSSLPACQPSISLSGLPSHSPKSCFSHDFSYLNDLHKCLFIVWKTSSMLYKLIIKRTSGHVWHVKEHNNRRSNLHQDSALQHDMSANTVSAVGQPSSMKPLAL